MQKDGRNHIAKLRRMALVSLPVLDFRRQFQRLNSDHQNPGRRAIRGLLSLQRAETNRRVRHPTMHSRNRPVVLTKVERLIESEMIQFKAHPPPPPVMHLPECPV